MGESSVENCCKLFVRELTAGRAGALKQDESTRAPRLKRSLAGGLPQLVGLETVGAAQSQVGT